MTTKVKDPMTESDSILSLTLADATAKSDAEIGQQVRIIERGNNLFSYIAFETSNNLDIIECTGNTGQSIKLLNDFTVNASAIYTDEDSIPSYIALMASRIGGVLIIDKPLATNPITLGNNTTIKGMRDESTWARTATFESPYKLTLADNSDDYAIKVNAGTLNYSIENLTIDGNKANQSSYDSGCIKVEYVGSSRAIGGIIKGVKCVNAKGWGGYIQGGPLQIIDTFFMSGCLIVDGSDIKINNVDFDGTDGFHTALCVVNTGSAEAWSNIFCFGYGEISPINNVQEITGTVTASGNITFPSDLWLYDGAPVVCSTTLPSTKPYNVYFAFKNGSTWEIYTFPKENARAVKAVFPSNGGITLSHGGKESAAYMSGVFRCGMSGVRFGGSNAQGLVMADCNRNVFSGVQTFNNNLRGISASSVELLDCSRNRFSLCQFGEIAKGVNNSVVLNQSSNELCTFNVFDETCDLTGNASGIDLVDNTSQPYSNRNRFYIQAQDDSSVNYISANKDKEPGMQVAQILVNGNQAITASSNQTINITGRYNNGISVTGGDTIELPVTKGGVYRIDGKFGFADPITSEMLVRIDGLGGPTGSTTIRNYSSDKTSIFDIEFRSIQDATLSITFIIFTAQTGLTLLSSPDWSWITVRKVADSKFDGSI